MVLRSPTLLATYSFQSKAKSATVWWLSEVGTRNRFIGLGRAVSRKGQNLFCTISKEKQLLWISLSSFQLPSPRLHYLLLHVDSVLKSVLRIPPASVSPGDLLETCSQAPPQTYSIKSSGVELGNLWFHKPSRWGWCLSLWSIMLTTHTQLPGHFADVHPHGLISPLFQLIPWKKQLHIPIGGLSQWLTQMT